MTVRPIMYVAYASHRNINNAHFCNPDFEIRPQPTSAGLDRPSLIQTLPTCTHNKITMLYFHSPLGYRATSTQPLSTAHHYKPTQMPAAFENERSLWDRKVTFVEYLNWLGNSLSTPLLPSWFIGIMHMR